jgi:LysR family transcriptional regulator, regulator for metE and metH
MMYHHVMDLDVRHLKLVRSIAELGSVTRAAERLHVTQSALSHQLRDIESRLGTPLFLRLGKRMLLTPPGERVLLAAVRVLEDLERAEEEIRQMASHGRGVLRLAAQCNTGYHWLPPLLETFHRDYPGIDVRIEAEATNRPRDYLLDGRLDLALLTDPEPDERLQLRPLFKDEMVLLTAPGHRLAARTLVEPAELTTEHLMIYAASRDDSFAFKRILDPAGVTPARVSHVMLTEAIISMVTAGLGVSVLARWTVEPAIRDGVIRAVPITRAGVFRQWSAATLRCQAQAPYLTAFVELVARQALPARCLRAAPSGLPPGTPARASGKPTVPHARRPRAKPRARARA